MKKVLKGWLIDNSVTTDNKTDKILLLDSAGSLDLDDVRDVQAGHGALSGDIASLGDTLPLNRDGFGLERLQREHGSVPFRS